MGEKSIAYWGSRRGKVTDLESTWIEFFLVLNVKSEIDCSRNGVFIYSGLGLRSKT